MRAKCRTNNVAAIEPPILRQHVERYVHLDAVDLSVGQCYAVLGVLFWDGIPWFLVCEEDEAEYPKPNCSIFFDLEEDSVPSGWRLTLVGSNVGPVAILPEEWARDPYFLEKLVDGDMEAQRTFQEIKRRHHA